VDSGLTTPYLTEAMIQNSTFSGVRRTFARTLSCHAFSVDNIVSVANQKGDREPRWDTGRVKSGATVDVHVACILSAII
jgi:putative component of membrane protein insertase Oxa1/YidC/SpoIIIJ protein YidD